MAARRRVALVVLTTSALAGGILTGAVAQAAPGGASAPAPAPAPAPTRPTEVHTIALPDRAAALTTGPGAATAPTVADSGEQSTAGFSMVGVSWDRASAATATFSVRTRAGGRWTGWSSLTTTDVGPDGGRADDRASQRRATDPRWVGPSDGVQVRLVSAPQRPTGVRIELVDPGAAPVDAQLAADPAAQQPVGTASSKVAPSAVARRAPGVAPAIISRGAWGADERLRSYNPDCARPDYSTTIKMGFVHHTDNANTYGPGDSAALVRSIYAYHVQGNRWCDIGYNFLVDRFGRIFEGRYGGVDKPVVGAHTGGFNADTFGVSMLGDFTAVAPPAALLNSVADLFAWKLGGYYRDPTGRTVLTAGVFAGSRFPVGSRVTFNTISGHRDADLTTCPGNAGYAALGTLRSMVASRYPVSPIGAVWNWFGREKSAVGEATIAERAVAGGLVTGFASGVMTSSPATGVRALITTGSKYLALGGPLSVLGFPTANEGPTVTPGGRTTKLQRGDLYYSPATGVREVHGDIDRLYGALGADRSPLGLPTSDETVRPDGRGRSNTFRGGAIYWLPTLGAHEVHGAIGATYARILGERGVLGYPTSNELIRPDRVGRANTFQRGEIYWTPGTGAHEVHGSIQKRWIALGSETNLGYPTSDETVAADGAGRFSSFQRGSVYWTRTIGAHEVRGAIRDAYVSLGAETSYLGYPTGYERVVSPGVVATDFQHGAITWNTGTGTVTTTPDPNP